MRAAACAALFLASMADGGELRTWTTRSGRTLDARLVELKDGRVVLEDAGGKRAAVAADALSEADCDFLEKLGVLRIARPRTWTSRSGKTVTATFARLDGAKVALTGETGQRLSIDLAQLSRADLRYVYDEAPVSPADWLVGSWEGWAVDGTAVEHFEFNVGPGPAGLKVRAVVRRGLARNQWEQALQKKLSAADVAYPRDTFGFTEDFALKAEGTNVTFSGTALERIFNPGKVDWETNTLQGSLQPGGFMTGFWPRASNDVTRGQDRQGKATDTGGPVTGRFYFARADLPPAPPELTLARGQKHSLACGDWHYKLYVPEKYDPEKPAPILINDSAGANAGPLSTAAADELGWIMVGLTEASNDTDWPTCLHNTAAALFDARQRLNLDMRRVYFSGLSGGARRSSFRAHYWPDQTAGVFLIGAGYGDTKVDKVVLDRRVPIFFLVGQTDMNNDEVAKQAFPREQQAGRPCQILVHPGGHTWGRPEDHVAGIRWLAAQAPAGAVPTAPGTPTTARSEKTK